MNKRVKKLWLKALRSGKYIQGRGRLVNKPKECGGDHKFCCLGVLSDAYYLEKNEDFPEVSFDEGGLSIEVKKWAGLFNRHGPDQNNLINMNDTDGRDFNYIADHIETNL